LEEAGPARGHPAPEPQVLHRTVHKSPPARASTRGGHEITLEEAGSARGHPAPEPQVSHRTVQKLTGSCPRRVRARDYIGGGWLCRLRPAPGRAQPPAGPSPLPRTACRAFGRSDPPLAPRTACRASPSRHRIDFSRRALLAGSSVFTSHHPPTLPTGWPPGKGRRLSRRTASLPLTPGNQGGTCPPPAAKPLPLRAGRG